MWLRLPLLVLALLPAGAGSAGNALYLENPSAYVPPQCYTRTQDETGAVHNPCATCHVRPRVPNFVNDAGLQTAYDFPGPARANPWTNLFTDRRPAVAAALANRAELIAWLRQDNYHDATGAPALAATLAEVPADWDSDGDGRWSGYVPDAYFSFDSAGFDLAPDGSRTGWRAFVYTPLPGSFWPANGSTDDVLIRLPEAFREDVSGRPDARVYETNLAITEALIRRRDIAIPSTDEAAMGTDLDGDGVLGTATRIGFRFAPLDGVTMHYAGRAGLMQAAGEAPLAAGLYPLRTEFLHSVRYVDPGEGGDVRMAPRMKELRYMRKISWQSYYDLETKALAEEKEAYDFPDRLAMFYGSPERGIANGRGWRLQGFIEDAQGVLRPQSFEETVFCMGCHGGLGITDDSTFAFPRKLDAPAGGWQHWSQGAGLRGLADPLRADGTGDYAHYLATNHAGDEFRGNAEILAAWFDARGAVKPEMAARLAGDIATLAYPSPERALALDAAYREIVREQSFIRGRDATIAPQSEVWRQVPEDQETGIETPEPAWFGR
jgi:hypothetical protein